MKPRILVVDDEKLVRLFMCRWFAMQGFEADQASDGIEAIDKCEASNYDVVTMDLEMPRMGGLDAIVVLKDKQPSLPIVVVTAYVSDPAALERAGVDEVFLKPVSLPLLDKQIRHILAL